MTNILDREMANHFADRPQAVSCTEFSRRLTLPDIFDDYGHPVEYDPESHPWQKHVLELFDGKYGKYQKFLLMADTQGGGKSWLMQIKTSHETVEIGRSVVYGLPTRDLKDMVWEQKIRPAIFGSGLGKYMPTSGPGSRSGAAPRSIKFRVIDGYGGGRILFMSANSRRQAGQASVTVQTLIVDELDDWTEDAAARIERRVDRFASTGKACVVCGGTIKDDHSSLTQRTYEEGAQYRVHYRCVDCGEYTLFDWDTFDPDAECIACVNCSVEIDEDKRQLMMGDTKFIPMNPSSKTASTMATALDCPWKSLAWLSQEYKTARQRANTGSHKALRQFHRDQMVCQYRGDASQDNPTRDFLAMRSARSDYARNTAPDWPHRIVVAVDIQGDRVYWLAMARSLDGERYAILEWREEYYTTKDKMGTEASDEQRAALLDSVYNRVVREGWADSDGQVSHAEAVVVDIGYESKAIGDWVRNHHLALAVRGTGDVRVKLTKLQGQVVKILVGGIVKRRRQKHSPGMPKNWYFIETENARTIMHNAVLLDEKQPGAILVPKGVARDSRLFRHMCAWEAREDIDSGRVRWVQVSNRDDFDDCAIYAWTMHQALEQTKWFTANATKEPEPITPQQQPAVMPQPNPSQWVQAGGAWNRGRTW